MATAAPQPSSFDELAALNDEIAALVRAGVPLETGLAGFAGAAAERLTGISGRLAHRLGEGASMSEAIDAEGAGLPGVYRAIVEAGWRSGRLTRALESLSSFSRNLQDVRQRISLSLIYPCIVLITAYYLFWFAIGEVLPWIGVIALAPGEAEPSGWLSTVRMVHRLVVSAGHIPPLLLVLGATAWFVIGRSTSRTRGISGAILRWIPGLGPAVRSFQLANFVEMAAILLEQGVSLPTVWRLAAETTGNAKLIADAEVLASFARNGEPLSERALAGTSLPSFVQWMIRSGERQGTLAASLRQVHAVYHRRAVQRIDRFKMMLPAILTIVIGGGVICCYTLALWLPLVETLRNLSAL